MATVLFYRSTSVIERVRERAGWPRLLRAALGLRTFGIDVVIQVNAAGDQQLETREVFAKRALLAYEFLLPNLAIPVRFASLTEQSGATVDPTSAAVVRLMRTRLGASSAWGGLDPLLANPGDVYAACTLSPECTRLHP